MSFKNTRLVKINAHPRDYFQQTAKRGERDYIMSVSGLKEFIECPAKFLAKDEDDEATASKDWGSLIDCLLLVPEQFNERFAVTPETYPDSKTGEPKKWAANATYCRDWKESRNEAGIEIVRRNTYDEALKAVARMKSDSRIMTFINDSDKQVWLATEWHDEKTGLVIPFRVMLDLRPRNDSEFYKCLGDMKAIKSAALVPFQRQVFQYKWHVQAAAYHDVYVSAFPNEDRCTWCFVIQENKPPFQFGRRILSEEFDALGRATYTRALANYCQCLKHNHWPDFDETDESADGWSFVKPEPWMESDGLFAPHFEFENESPDAEPAPAEGADQGIVP